MELQAHKGQIFWQINVMNYVMEKYMRVCEHCEPPLSIHVVKTQ